MSDKQSGPDGALYST